MKEISGMYQNGGDCLNSFLMKYSEADELHVPAYGESFLQDMIELIKKDYISPEEAIKIIQCLIDVDEVRILLAGEIRELIVTFIEEKKYDDSLLCLFRKMSDAYVDGHSGLYRARMQGIIYDILDDKLSVSLAQSII